MENVCKNKKVAHFGEQDITGITAAKLSEEKGCMFLMLEKPMDMVFLSIAVPKESPYRAAFNYQ